MALERGRPIRVVNWIHLLAEAMGLAHTDEYKLWRNAEDPRANIGAARIEPSGTWPSSAWWNQSFAGRRRFDPRARLPSVSLHDTGDGERFDVAYLVLSGTTTAARCPEALRGLVGLGFTTVLAIPSPNASRVIASRELADVEGVQVVE